MNSGIKVSFLLSGMITGLFLSGCSENREQSFKPSSNDSVKVMTFNIRYGTANDGENSWQYRKKAFFMQIADLSPDVAGLQEALEFQVQEIREAFPAYGTVGVGRDDGIKEGEQCCILYRKDRFELIQSGTFWFSDTPEAVGSKSWGNVLSRICTWARFVETQTGNKFYVYNVHLDNQSAQSRMKSVELLARKVCCREEQGPFVVMGDFNCGPDSLPIHYLLGQSDVKSPLTMVDVLAAVRPGQKEIGTYHGFSGRTDGTRIDMIFVPAEVEMLDANIDTRLFDGRRTSDHFPVFARLGFFK